MLHLFISKMLPIEDDFLSVFKGLQARARITGHGSPFSRRGSPVASAPSPFPDGAFIDAGSLAGLSLEKGSKGKGVAMRHQRNRGRASSPAESSASRFHRLDSPPPGPVVVGRGLRKSLLNQAGSLARIFSSSVFLTGTGAIRKVAAENWQN